jgi:hypothetical protein
MSASDISVQQSSLHRQLAMICIKIDGATHDTDRNRLADEADQICQQLGIPLVDRALLGKPFVYGETELQP